MESLPVSHQLLLRYLMIVLRRVGDNCANNEMTSYNVAACVGQCLLWPPPDLSVSSESRLVAAKRLNHVVEKMIDGAYEIFGSDSLPFLEKPKSSYKTGNVNSKVFFLFLCNLCTISDNIAWFHDYYLSYHLQV